VEARGERALIERAKEWDKGAWAEIYERHKQSIYRYVYYRVGDEGLAEELTGEVFLRALESIESFTFRGVSLVGWLYRIAKHLVIDHHREQRQQLDVSLDEDVAVTEEGPGEIADKRRTCEQLEKALGQLTQEQREVVILRIIDGLPLAEVAQVMGKTRGAIKSLQHRGLASLRRILKEAS